MIPKAVATFREEYRRTRISKYYSGIVHFCFTSIVSLAAIAYAIHHLKDVRVAEWLTVPITFLFANFVEYKGHRGPMHHRTGWGYMLFRRHTLEHHRFFTHEAMIYDASRDFKMVLFPPEMLIFFIGLHAVPVGFALFYLTSANVAFLFVAVAIGYFLTYEWLHFCYHLREDSWAGRLPFMRRLRRLHTEHHNPALMNHYNFNITFPISDALFGTRYRGEEGRGKREEGRGKREEGRGKREEGRAWRIVGHRAFGARGPSGMASPLSRAGLLPPGPSGLWHKWRFLG